MNNNHFKDYRFTGLLWTMDYPCEAKVREKGKYSPLTAQDMTIKNQIKLPGQGVNTQMVVQGYSLDEYPANLDKIKSKGKRKIFSSYSSRI
jgi:hypothetical protein